MIDLFNAVNKDMQITIRVELMNRIIFLSNQHYFFFSHLIKVIIQLVLFSHFDAILIRQLSGSETNEKNIQDMFNLNAPDVFL